MKKLLARLLVFSQAAHAVSSIECDTDLFSPRDYHGMFRHFPPVTKEQVNEIEKQYIAYCNSMPTEKSCEMLKDVKRVKMLAWDRFFTKPKSCEAYRKVQVKLA